MDRAWLSGASATPPVAPVSPSLGHPTAGDPGVGLPATVPGPWWHHMVTEELRALIEAAGLTPSHLNLTQVRDAINKLAVRRSVASLQVSVAGNALTGTLAAEALEFRSSTLTNGASVTRVAPVAASLTVPSGATLGTVSGVQARLVWGWIDNAGTLEPFVANMDGGINLDESTLVNTVAISAAANSANVIYSHSARTGVAFRVRGYCVITEGGAGVWASAPVLVQGCGGTVYGGFGGALLENNGFQELPSGLILNWGRGLYSNAQFVSFAMAFPKLCFGVISCADSLGAGPAIEISSVGEVSASGFKVYGLSQPIVGGGWSGYTGMHYWLSIGK